MKKITHGEIHYGTGTFYGGDEEVFYLDHSCDEWVIGDLEDAKKFAEDLLETIAEVEATPQQKPKRNKK